LCHDLDIQDAYFDGILRVELGERADNLLGLVSDLIKMITGEPEGFNTIDAAASRLSEALGDRRFLLVIDDAWREQDLRPFLRGGPNTTRLITTRIDTILGPDTARVPVDAMRGTEAVALLARNLPEDQVDEERERFVRLAARLGEWPFLLTLVNRSLAARVLQAHEPLVRALDGVGRRLELRGLVAFDAKDEGARDHAVSRTIEVSLELLDESEHARFDELAVFPEDTDVPVGIVARLWAETGGLDDIDVEDFLEKLAGLSLVLALDLERCTFRLHDVMRSYLMTKAGKDRVRALHTILAGVLKADADQSPIAAEREYVYRYLPAHLDGAGDRTSLDRLLLDLAWMRAKLEATGPHTLISDYRNLGRGRAQELVGSVLDLTSGILARDPKQLECQLLARLAPDDAEGLDAFLDQARDLLPSPALVPQRPTFTAPGSEIRRFEGHDDAVTGLAVLSPDRFVSCSHDKTLRLWEASTAWQVRRLEGHEGKVHAVVRCDERRVASASEDRTIRIWDVETGEEVHRIHGHEDEVTCLAMLGGHILSGSKDNMVRLWDVATGAELRRFEGHDGAVTCVAFAGDHVLSAAEDKTLRLWDAATGKQVRELATDQAFKRPVRAITVLDDGRVITGGSDYGFVRVWDLSNGAELRRFDGIRFWADALCLLDADRIAIGTAGYCEVEIRDVHSGDRLYRNEPQGSSILSVTSPDDKHLLTSDWGTIRLWSLEGGYQLERSGRGGWVASFLVLDDKRLVSGSWDGSMTLWDRESGRELLRFEGHRGWVRRIMRLDERRIASCGWYDQDKLIKVWDLSTGAELRRLEGHERGICALAMLDAQRIISASFDKTVRIWDFETDDALTCLTGHEGTVYDIAVLDAQHVVSCSADQTLRLWSVGSAMEVRRMTGHGSEVNSVAAIGPRTVVSVSDDRTLRVWDIETGDELRRITLAHMPYELAVIDTDHVVVALTDNTLRLWRLSSGKELARIEGDTGFDVVTVLSDRQTIAARDGVARLHLIDLHLPN
jgi:WD40 repeat protein